VDSSEGPVLVRKSLRPTPGNKLAASSGRNSMKYHVYFDGYGHAKGAVSEKDLAEKYEGDPKLFLRAMCGVAPDGGIELTSGHVGTMNFESEKDLQEYLAGCGDEITGFYECDSDSRPYNF
jgi:hypothetical protein